MTRSRLLLLVAAALLCAAASFERTEERTPCADFDAMRRPFFGDTHVHTAYSFDAAGQGTRGTPRAAYRFARGESIGIQPYDASGRPGTEVQLRRPLDFAIVTDHSDLLGETRICQTPSAAGYDSLVCTVTRRWPLLGYMLVNGYVYGSDAPQRYSFCGPGGSRCLEAARPPWHEIQAAAEEFYDRSAACEFTTFVGYEWTGMPGGANLHRNVIFRNEVVQAAPTTYLETPRVEGLWRALREQCIDLGNRCDALAIPHNPNVSNGSMFSAVSDGARLSARDARTRSAMEPLLEVTQHKGDSECRAGAEDELCDYETLPWPRMMDAALPWRWQPPPPLSYAREALTAGLEWQAELGANPYKLGLIGSTDSHFATPGLVDEDRFVGHAAGTVSARFGIPDFPDDPRFNPGGLAVLWAEENSRDALFAAMRRREAYGTSGPRMVVRFFGGWALPRDLCEGASFAARGYAAGVPMGADLPSREIGDEAPRFAVLALRDPAPAAGPSAPLQRIQIVKSWVEDGRGRERVFELAGDPGNGAAVDPLTCKPRGDGFDSLCGLWTDPDFDPSSPALYYARVLENPSCRWNAYVCNRRGIDCNDPETVPASLASCCDPAIPRTIQERAWTSPIWYEPTG